MREVMDLEIGLYCVTSGQYRVETRLNNPYTDVMTDPQSAIVELPIQQLEALRSREDWVGYGGLLSDLIFRGNGASNLYKEAVRTAADNRTAVRLRLIIDEGANQLHSLVWETLLDPGRVDPRAPAWLSATPQIYFSRFLTGGRVREISLRQKFQVRALVFIANPRMFGANLPPIDVEAELQLATAGLQGIVTTTVASSHERPGQATLANLINQLGRAYDILYLVCHGYFNASETRDTVLLFEDAQGGLDEVSGKRFIAATQNLEVPPNLIILVSCQTAGDPSLTPSGSDAAKSDLGPRLIRAGVPAVLAMQGRLQMATAREFLPALLGSLQSTGIIDCAVSEARSKIADSSDFYAPVLFHRLKSGRIWYGEDRASTDQDNVSWAALLDLLADGDGTVILGSGLLEPYVGSQAELATRLAKRFQYAFSDKNRDDIALVTQYIAALSSPTSMQRAVLRETALQVIRHYGDVIPELLKGKTIETRLAQEAGLEDEVDELIDLVWRRRCDADPFEPHKLLAQMPFKAYVSTDPDHLIELALSAFAKTNPDRQRNPTVWKCGKEGDDWWLGKGLPNALNPLVAYVYGTFGEPKNMVLTEGDYFHHLFVSATSGMGSVKELNRIFTNSALVFLGFRLHEWDFRIFFRRLREVESWSHTEDYQHVAVQIDPSSSGGLATASEVRKFLRKFLNSERIDIFEGSVEQFVRTLYDRLRARAPAVVW